MSAPPRLRGLPLVGLGPRMLGDALAVVREAAALGPVVALDMGRMPAYHLVTPPAGVHEVLTHGQRRRFEAMTILLGDGLAIAPTGDAWRRQRRLMQPMFARRRLAGLHPLICAATLDHLDGPWRRAAAAGELVDAAPALRRLTLDVILRTMLGAALPPEAGELGEHLRVVLDFVNRRVLAPIKAPLSWPLPAHRRFARSNRALRAIAERLLRARGAPAPVDAGPIDLLGLLVAARDEESGEGMSADQIRDEIMTIVLAGHETTATALTWALWLLLRHPDALAQVRDEAVAVLGGRAPTPDELALLPHGRQALLEAMRLYPPVWAMFREFAAPRQVCGVDLPADAPVIVCPWLTHRLPEHWPDPERFLPARFAAEASAGRPRCAYFPFGAGAHQCIGMEFALAEAQVVLASLVQRFDIALASTIPAEPRVVFTLTPKAPILLRLRPRG